MWMIKLHMTKLTKKFEVQEEGYLGDYLGIQITKDKDRSLLLTQPQLIESILQDLNLHQENVKGCTTPALKTVLIHRDAVWALFDSSFHCRSVIWKLNYLEKST